MPGQQGINGLLSRHASNDDTSIVSGLGVADEPPWHVVGCLVCTHAGKRHDNKCHESL